MLTGRARIGRTAVIAAIGAIVGLGVPAVARVGLCAADRPGPASCPVRLYGLMDRMGPETRYTDAELRVIAEKYDVITGLDGHGYNFPGVIARVKAINPDICVLCSWDSMGVQATSPRFDEFDPCEDLFIHSADPASLRIVDYGGGAVGWFRQDGRAVQDNPYYKPPGVRAYVVEYADEVAGAFSSLGPPIAESGALHYRFTDGLHPQRRYRIRTQLADGRLVDYSWAAQPQPRSAAVLAAVELTAVQTAGVLGFTHDLRKTAAGDWQVRPPTGLGRTLNAFTRRGQRQHVPESQPAALAMAVCYGGGCPEDPGGVVLEMDADNDRKFGEADGSGPRERWPFQTAERLGDGGRLYTARMPLPSAVLFSYRAMIEGHAESRCPSEGSYQRSGYNNRIRNPFHSSFLVWPEHPRWRQKLHERLQACMENGYDGMRLDFAFDTLEPHWVASGLPPDWGGASDRRIADGVTRLLTELPAVAPQAKVTFNGFFMQGRAEYYRRVSALAGADFEYFAFGVVEDATSPDARTLEALAGVLETRRLGKWAMAVAGRNESDLAARLQSLALYLLVADEGVYFFFATCCASEDVAYFPEWDVPLGAPVRRVRDLADLNDPRAPDLMKRTYESGCVFFNGGERPTDVPLDDTYYELSITGGKSPMLGGRGAAHYTATPRLKLGPRQGAILVRRPP